MAGVLRLLSGFVVAAGFIVAWLAFAWLVMLVILYVVRVIPLTGRRRKSKPVDSITSES